MEVNDMSEILMQYSQGSTKLYDILVNHLTSPEVKEELLLQCLSGLKGSISLLTKEFEQLVGVILKIDWLAKTISVIKEYQAFVTNLVSAHTDYLRACLRMLVKHFVPTLDKTSSHLNYSTVTIETRKIHDERFFHLHYLLRNIYKLIPMTPTLLIPILTEYFPYITAHTYVHACYVRNLLQLTQYMPKHRVQILELLIDKMSKLDVRAPREAIQETMEDSDEEMESLFFMDDIESCSDELKATKVSSTAEGQPMTHQEADRLDVMMHYLLEFTEKTCHQNKDELDWQATKKLYKEFLTIFDKIVLPTHASCHVQFFMFFIIQYKQPLIEGFIDYLWKKVTDPNTQPVFRQAAVAYIASLLCRAKYITISTVSKCLEIMTGWSHSYIVHSADSGSVASVANHGPFYSVCQSIFYIMAFRAKQILQMQNGYKICESLNLQSIVTCRLNPLKFCLPIVARIFATTVRNHQLAYCDGIMEHNRRMTLPEEGSRNTSQTRLTHLNPLDSFFPFDPYFLSRSGKFIHPIYQEFEGSAAEVGNENEVNSSDKMVEQSEEEEFELESYRGQIMATSPTELLMYSISPGFKHVHT